MTEARCKRVRVRISTLGALVMASNDRRSQVRETQLLAVDTYNTLLIPSTISVEREPVLRTPYFERILCLERFARHVYSVPNPGADGSLTRLCAAHRVKTALGGRREDCRDCILDGRELNAVKMSVSKSSERPW